MNTLRQHDGNWLGIWATKVNLDLAIVLPNAILTQELELNSYGKIQSTMDSLNLDLFAGQMSNFGEASE